MFGFSSRESVEGRTGSVRPPSRFWGSGLFGLGWGVADACPAPIAAQLGQGVGWAVFTAAGAALGILMYMKLRAVETEPASDAARHGVALATAE